MPARTAFVTGGTGFVGINLVKELKAQGWHVVALHRPTSKLNDLKPLDPLLVEGSLTDRDSLRRAMPPGVDAVFNVAADLSFDRKGDAAQTRVNVDGTRNMVEAALAAGARRFVQTSSVAAYGLQPGVISEATPSTALAMPVNYARTKFLSEEAVRAGVKRGLEAVILNPANIVGPHDRHGWARLIRLVATRKLPGVGPGGGAFCHVREVVKAHVAAVDEGRSGENYLLGGVHASYLEFARAAAAIAGGRAPKRAMPPWLVRLLARVMPPLAGLTGLPAEITPEVALMLNLDFRVDSARAIRELGYREVPLGEMVEDAARWLKAEGLIP
jgi:nucleoside-diphosphate-sugar epimerase